MNWGWVNLGYSYKKITSVVDRYIDLKPYSVSLLKSEAKLFLISPELDLKKNTQEEQIIVKV